MKRTFFSGGMQGSGWWKLMVVAYELADRLIIPTKLTDEGGRNKTETPKTKKIR